MSLTVEVSLISGKAVSLQTHGDESVESLRERVTKAACTESSGSWQRSTRELHWKCS